MLSKEHSEIYEAWVLNVAKTKTNASSTALTLAITEKAAISKIIAKDGKERMIKIIERSKLSDMHQHRLNAIRRATDIGIFIPKKVFKSVFYKIFWEFESEDEEQEYIKAALRKI